MKRKVFTVIGILFCLGLLFIYEVLWAPNVFQSDRFITVSKGENFSQVVDSLQRWGIIRSRLLFDLAGRFLNLTTKMQIGKYRFENGMSNKEILEDLRFGQTIEFILVILPEGLKASRQAKILSHALRIDSARFMNFVNDSNFAAQLGAGNITLEGCLMPATYKFYWQMDEREIIKQMVSEFWKVFNDTFQARVKSRGMSMNEILTIASIVESETSIDSERAVIAGVYHNRLKRRMRLQADPTIQYILDDGPRRLRYSDLRRESAYNTYRHYGLPPGPVNNPGKASILAALYPAKHKFLFFVANGQGGHVFSRTFNQHKRAAIQYRKLREEQDTTKEG